MAQPVDNAPKRLKLAAYLRVSSNAQAETDTIELQRQAITRWAKTHGHRITSWCEDVALSGSLDADNRPGLACVTDALETGAADAVVFTKLDRLARELHVQEGTLAMFWERGATVIACDEGGEVLADDPADPMRTAMRQMVGVFAQLERGQIRMRLEQGRNRKADEGGYTGGAPRYGYKAEGKELADAADERAVINRMVAMRRDGASYRAICQALNDDGVPAKRGGQWLPATVRRVLVAEDAG